MGLPNGYTELEYIESSGTQYFDSGLKGNQNMRIDADYSTTATIGSICGADQDWGLNMFTIEVHFSAFANSNYHYSPVPSRRHRVSLNNGAFSLDGTTLTTMTGGTFETPVNVSVFALNRSGHIIEYGSINLYSLQMYLNNTIARDFVPCIRDSDGAAGMYDLVEQKFYGNAGSGSFIAGPEVINDAIYVKVNGIWKKIDGIKIL